MTRIKSSNIQLGSSFIMPIEQAPKVDANLDELFELRKKIVEAAEIKAREMVANAEKQAQELSETLKAEALAAVESIKTAAHQEGFDAGRQEGLDKAVEEMTEKIYAVDTFAKSNFDIKKNIVKSAELDIVKLIVEISDKVCGKAFEVNEGVLKEITENAIKSLKDKESVTIIINPELADRIYSISEEIKTDIQQLEFIKIIEDTSVSPDGTIVESPLSRVDCRVKSQINEIAEKLMQGLRDVQ